MKFLAGSPVNEVPGYLKLFSVGWLLWATDVGNDDEHNVNHRDQRKKTQQKRQRHSVLFHKNWVVEEHEAGLAYKFSRVRPGNRYYYKKFPCPVTRYPGPACWKASV